MRIDAGADRGAADRQRRTRFRLSSMRACAFSSCADHAPNSCAKVSGIASIKCVRPVLTILPSAFARLSMVLRRWRAPAAGLCLAPARHHPHRGRDDVIAALAQVDVVVGMDRQLARCAARPAWAMTSLAFMLLEVPEPVWYTSTGNCASCAPPAMAVAASTIASACARASNPRCPLTSAAAALVKASARMNAAGIGRAADREIVDRALGLRAPERLRGHAQLAHAVVFDAEAACLAGGHGLLLCGFGRA
jgi:hypothetical protein